MQPEGSLPCSQQPATRSVPYESQIIPWYNLQICFFNLHFNIILLSTSSLISSGFPTFPSKPKPLNIFLSYILCRFVFQMFYCGDQRGNVALLTFILSGMHLASSASLIIKATRAPSNKTGSKPVNCVDLQVNGASKCSVCIHSQDGCCRWPWNFWMDRYWQDNSGARKNTWIRSWPTDLISYSYFLLRLTCVFRCKHSVSTC